MSEQPDLLMPRELLVPGIELPATLELLEAQGALVTALDVVSHCNGTWRLNICWPRQHQQTDPKLPI